MFSGIIERTGVITFVRDIEGGGRRITVNAGKNFHVKRGESVSVNGVCLTVVNVRLSRKRREHEIDFDISPETMRRTNLCMIEKGAHVNLERAIRLSQRISGHFVQGHILTTVKIKNIIRRGKFARIEFGLKSDIGIYILEKCFVALDGISLTVSEVKEESFFVDIIPETWRLTNLKFRKIGDELNFEPDIIVGTVVETLKKMKIFAERWN